MLSVEVVDIIPHAGVRRFDGCGCFGITHTRVSNTPSIFSKSNKLIGSLSWTLVELYFGLSWVPYKERVNFLRENSCNTGH